MKTYIVNIDEMRKPGLYDLPSMMAAGFIRHIFMIPKNTQKLEIGHTAVVIMDPKTMTKGVRTATGIKHVRMRVNADKLQVYEKGTEWSSKRSEMLVANSGFESTGPFVEYMRKYLGVNLDERRRPVSIVYLDGFGYSPMHLLCMDCMALKKVPDGSVLNADGTVLDDERNYVYCGCLRNSGKFHEFGSTYLYNPKFAGNYNLRLSNMLFEEISLGKTFEAFMYFNVKKTDVFPFSLSVKQDENNDDKTGTIHRRVTVSDKTMSKSTFDTMRLITGMGLVTVFKEQFRRTYRNIYGRSRNILEEPFTKKFIDGDISTENIQTKP